MDSTIQLIIYCATSVVTGVTNTAVAAPFIAGIAFARWAVCGVMKLSTSHTLGAVWSMTVYDHILDN